MKLTRTVSSTPRLLNLVPLVDVVFLLLIFFILGSVFVLQPGVSVVPPFSPFTLGPLENPQVVSVTSAPAAKIYYQDRELSLATLDQTLAAEPAEDRTIIIKADRHAPYDMIVGISTIGIRKGYSVVLATNPEPTQPAAP